MMIDLQPFCSTDPMHSFIHNPFSRGDWTYATDGHIMVRVPRRAGVGVNEKAPRAESVVPDLGKLEFRRLKQTALPATRYTECGACGGDGKAHGCPSCKCVCPGCDGTGKEAVLMSVMIGSLYVDVKYAAALQRLPKVFVAEASQKNGNPCIAAKFDGGEAVLMALTGPFPTHRKIVL